MLGWVRTILPSWFHFTCKKEAPIGVPGTSIRSVPTFTGEGINTKHTRLYFLKVKTFSGQKTDIQVLFRSYITKVEFRKVIQVSYPQDWNSFSCTRIPVLMSPFKERWSALLMQWNLRLFMFPYIKLWKISQILICKIMYLNSNINICWEQINKHTNQCRVENAERLSLLPQQAPHVGWNNFLCSYFLVHIGYQINITCHADLGSSG